MALLDRITDAFSRAPPLPVFHHPLYRLPLPGLEASLGIEPRRADFVRWFLEDQHPKRFELRAPDAVGYDELHRVHTAQLLERLTSGEAFTDLFNLPTERVPVDALMLGVRLAAGGTLDAARDALEHRRPAFNLLGGFHHATPERAAGLCPVNDLAIAVSALRTEGFDDDVLIIDLDAHPPDGLAACFAGDERVRIGSLSGSDWGPLDVDETVLEGADDATYLSALDALLHRQPAAALNFYIAGGDVLAGDRLGLLQLSEAGVRVRDERVLAHFSGRASVWLPGGGYHRGAWRLLAQSALVAQGASASVPADYDPLAAHYARVSSKFTLAESLQEGLLTEDEMDEAFGQQVSRAPRFLGAYLLEDVQRALVHFGISSALEALGYAALDVLIDHTPQGDRVRVFGRAVGRTHLLIEIVASREEAAGRPVLFVNWLTLRDPLRAFDDEAVPYSAPLPGQDYPGLGLSLEAGLLLERIAARTRLAGIMLRPAWFHVARAAVRRGFRFTDEARHARYLELAAALKGVPLPEASRRVAENETHLGGEPYVWEATDLVRWLSDPTDR